MKKPLLIVDGYNMIGAWPELVQLKNKDLMEDAREQLLQSLSNYAKYEKLAVIVVFDAQFVPGVTKNYARYQLEVVFTEEGETADSYIERIAGKLNDIMTQVSVATSDLAEQWVIFSQGALRVSARELYKTVKKTEEAIKRHQESIKYTDYRRNSPWDEKQLKKLEEKLRELS
ncbi:NYN domain-containing protein [Tetragenococcus halophilus]|uniref:NYN domain-containing protein n=2 Tax=Tetragenococcus halophilus TaxID=51669 RepID=A0AAN1SDY8_TETHN|nr:NYN domain-containing protein [Tetragenococcus halophilus]AOF47954.1 DNA-binding protein [Tetragenococcus halophilus]MCF1674897.1 NYN domain-containing protein [Tetragenococcus halophilus]MCO7025849.1 NYN domain-containing protein [Tetragenococcus halophilus]MCO8286789.1 NYN domain-containing protein [Tetragenococcus halophilus]MCO8288445.1 NYN domain-containing protein [Tetragenococcus halophilus]